VAWYGQYIGKSREPTSVLDAVALEYLWILHYFFGLLGSLNDIDVSKRSHLFARLASGDAPACNYTMNEHDYKTEYYLADDIYPSWSTFVKTITNPINKEAS
jgi:hypothetical protein